MRAKEKERAKMDSKELEDHSLVKKKHRVLNGGQKKILLGGQKERKVRKASQTAMKAFRNQKKSQARFHPAYRQRRGPKRKGQGRRSSSSWIVVYLSLPSSSDDYHPLHSCLGTGERVGTQNRFCLHRASLAHLVSSIAFCCCWCFGGGSITILPLLV